MATYLDRLIGYGSWANQGLLDFLAERPPETLALTTSGVFGTIDETLEHLLRSEVGYARRLVGLPRLEREERPGPFDLAYLQGLATESAGILADLVEKLPEPGTMIPTRTGKRAAATHLTQLILHGDEHRGHVGTILGANGIEPPDLDAWAHGILVHGDAWPDDWGPEPAR